MKKHASAFTIVMAVVIIALGVLAYFKFIRPVYLFNPTRTLTVDLKHTNLVQLINENEAHTPFGIEIEITAQTNDHLSVLISGKDRVPIHQVQLKKGSIDYIYKNDWYSDTCLLYFQSNFDGKINVDYRFLNLK